MVGNIGTLSWNNLTIICLRDQNHVFRVDEFFRLSTFVLGGTRYIMLDLYSTKFYIKPSALKIVHESIQRAYPLLLRYARYDIRCNRGTQYNHPWLYSRYQSMIWTDDRALDDDRFLSRNRLIRREKWQRKSSTIFDPILRLYKGFKISWHVNWVQFILLENERINRGYIISDN